MPMLSRTCPECHSQSSSSVGDRIAGAQLVWFESFRCPQCGYSLEVEDQGVAGLSVRQAIIAETGLWGWRVPTTDPALLETLIQLRQKLDLKALRVAGFAAIKRKAPGILAVGTRAEIELLVSIAKDSGLESLAEQVPSNAYAPLDFANFSHRSGAQKRANDVFVGLEPLKFSSADFVSLGSFRLARRWTDPRHAVLPPQSLALIRPFTDAKAFEAWRRLGRFLDESFHYNFSFSHERFPEMEWLDLTSGYLDVRAWLNGRLPDPNEEIIISWDQQTAVLVPAKLFIEHWDDFHSGVHDMVLWPLDESWRLFLDHEQQLLFGRSRQS